MASLVISLLDRDKQTSLRVWVCPEGWELAALGYSRSVFSWIVGGDGGDGGGGTGGGGGGGGVCLYVCMSVSACGW